MLFYVFYRAIVVRRHWASLSEALEVLLIDWVIIWQSVIWAFGSECTSQIDQ